MSRSRILSYANLDFEAELAGGARYRPSSQLQALMSRWQYVLRLLPGCESAECASNSESEASHAKGLEAPPDVLLLWGVTDTSKALAAVVGGEHAFPTVDAVTEVNDKRFSHAVERRMGISLPHSAILSSLEEFQTAVADCPFSWVLKHPLGFSARERMVGKRAQISESALGWARRKFEGGWTLLFEPWVEQRRDFSHHYEIAPDGTVEYLGHCELVSDPGGVYRGNRIHPERALEASVHDAGERIARSLWQRGYWGPLGIDAFTGSLGVQPVVRPLVEINARFSFGRLTLALAGRIPQGWSCLWWHPSRSDASRLPSGVPALSMGDDSTPLKAGIYRLPVAVDPLGASGTVVAIASDPDGLDRLETSLRA